MTFTTNPYCDVQQVYSALDLSSTAQTNDAAWIQELANEAQGDIDDFLGFSFQQDGTIASPSSRLYDGNGTDTLWTPGDRIISITQVLETTYNVFLSTTGVFTSGTTQTYDITADVLLGPTTVVSRGDAGYILRRKTGLPFSEGYQNYQVKGVFGRPSIPTNIQRACVRLCVHYYKMRDTNYASVVSEQGGVRQSYKKPMPDDVVEILERYKPHTFYGGSVGTNSW